jgi:hypothetical protein
MIHKKVIIRIIGLVQGYKNDLFENEEGYLFGNTVFGRLETK